MHKAVHNPQNIGCPGQWLGQHFSQATAKLPLRELQQEPRATVSKHCLVCGGAESSCWLDEAPLGQENVRDVPTAVLSTSGRWEQCRGRMGLTAWTWAWLQHDSVVRARRRCTAWSMGSAVPRATSTFVMPSRDSCRLCACCSPAQPHGTGCAARPGASLGI